MSDDIVFCSNPRCKRNKLVSAAFYSSMQEVDYEASYAAKAIIRDGYIFKKTVLRHKWVDPRLWDSEFYLCDDCHNLAIFLKGKSK
jgi:hypothetical protein